jgi:thiol-disulfide isomerase/thioredoxin
MRKTVLLIIVPMILSCSPKSPAVKLSASPTVIATQLKNAGLDVPKGELMSEDFTLEALNGSKVSLSSFRGKVVLLSFWATWCGPCKQEMPAMQSLYSKLKGKGFEILAVDMNEDKATVVNFVRTAGYTFPVLLDSTGAVGGGSYAARAIPTNYVVDKSGRIVGRKIGIDGPEWTSEERVALFESLLSQ